MKSLIAVIIISLFAAPVAGQARKSQSKKRPPAKPKTVTTTATTQPRIIGSQVVLVNKNGDEIRGVLLDLTAYSARIKADNLESTIALDTLTSISFGDAAVSSKQADADADARPEFLKDTTATLGAFQTMAATLKGSDYTDYDHSLRDVRPVAERFVGKYAVTESKVESQVALLISAALTDYSWARTIWTLKFGRSGDGAVSDTDSPAVAEALNLYTDLRASAATGNKFSADKIVAGLWAKAAEKIARARSLLSPTQ